MKLSMWMLLDWLKEYKPRHKINDGAANISGVRFIAGELREFPRDHVYIGRAAEIFDDVGYTHKSMLVHGYDFIFVDEPSSEILVNKVLAAIDYYNRWESLLWEASGSDAPMQKMIDLRRGFRPPLADHGPVRQRSGHQPEF